MTSANPQEALNFNRETHLAHADRYARAREFYEVVTGLWDSWADDAFIRNVEEGVFFDPEKLHILNHQGAEFSVRGPLNVGRPVQGWPVIVQAGASEAGRQIAAETAEAVFSANNTRGTAKDFYADMKSRVRACGRNPEHLKILPGVFVVIGDTVRRRKRRNVNWTHGASGQRPRILQSCSDATREHSISTGRCPRFQRPMPARAAERNLSRWRTKSA